MIGAFPTSRLGLYRLSEVLVNGLGEIYENFEMEQEIDIFWNLHNHQWMWQDVIKGARLPKNSKRSLKKPTASEEL